MKPLRQFLGWSFLCGLSVVMLLTLLYYARFAMHLDFVDGRLVAAAEPNPYFLYSELAMLVALILWSAWELFEHIAKTILKQNKKEVK